MKKFLVPVRYSAMIDRLPIPYSAWCHVEIESESIDKLIDDVRHNRIDVELPPVDALSYIDDDVEIDHDKSIIDLDSGEEFYLQKWSDFYEKIFSTSKLRGVGSS